MVKTWTVRSKCALVCCSHVWIHVMSCPISFFLSHVEQRLRVTMTQCKSRCSLTMILCLCAYSVSSLDWFLLLHPASTRHTLKSMIERSMNFQENSEIRTEQSKCHFSFLSFRRHKSNKYINSTASLSLWYCKFTLPQAQLRTCLTMFLVIIETTDFFMWRNQQLSKIS